jgi:hypothetical protein
MPSTEFKRICLDLMALSESGMHINTYGISIYAKYSVKQSRLKPLRTVSNSHVLVISVTVLSPYEATTMSRSRSLTSKSNSRNPSP